MGKPAQLPDVVDHGVLFKAEMVRALLAGTKTQTRRLVTSHNSLIDGHAMTKHARQLWPTLDFSTAWIEVDHG